MSRIIWILAFLALAGTAVSQEFSGLARIDAAKSAATDRDGGGVVIDLGLSQGVPYRLFTLSDPPRLVLDFKEVDWTGLSADRLSAAEALGSVRFGTYVPGWSRLVAELAGPLAVQTSSMTVDPVTGAAHLGLELVPTDPESFAAASGAPFDPRWDLPQPVLNAAPEVKAPGAPLVVVIDPGHGGIDPGAQTDGRDEKDLMLTFARELRETLLRSGGFEVQLTRDGDYFVSLERRVALAHQYGADVFISLHGDSLTVGQAHGAAVHILSREASDVASAKLAERHDRGDILAGVDLSDVDDKVTNVLLDLARQETQPRAEALAGAIVSGLSNAGGPMNRRPIRSAGYSVLKAADIPSVLVEVGFMSSPRDLKNLENPQWRAKMAAGIRNGLQKWREEDAALRPLVRK